MSAGGRGEADARTAAPGPVAEPGGSDLQGVLARAARRLAAETGATRVLVWEGQDEGGSCEAPVVRAAFLSAEERDRVFEPFFSSKPDRPGGLGLSISHRIAEEAKGRLALATPAGRGARFVLTLPWAC